MIMIKVS